MKPAYSMLSLTAFLVTAPVSAVGAVINFDDLPNNTVVTNQYASLGATFSLGNFGVKQGNSEGNDGNWNLEGTNGPHFLGFTLGSYSQTITWASDIDGFSLDVSRSNGSLAGDTFTLTGLRGGSVVDTETITLQDINTWSKVALTGIFDEIQWSGSSQYSLHPYGVDNLVFEQVPEPASFALLSLGLAGLAVMQRRRAN